MQLKGAIQPEVTTGPGASSRAWPHIWRPEDAVIGAATHIAPGPLRKVVGMSKM